MANIAVVVGVLLLLWFVTSAIRRRSHGIVPKRGIGVDADVAALREKPRVRVAAVSAAGPGRVRVVLTPQPDPDDDPRRATPPDLDLVVLLRETEPGFDLLQEWKLSGRSLAMVMPPDSRLVRLRSIDDLQPLTLRRADDR